jgi:hypothetical protein
MRALGAAAALLLCAAPAAAKKPPLPDYPVALRCAALTEAKSRLTPQTTREGRARFDEALFWGMTASESARTRAKITGARFTQDQADAGGKALAQLTARDPGALAELDTCRKQVPRLRRGDTG